MPPQTLYPFRYRDGRTGKWVRARYVATREDIAVRYGEWEITGRPEIRGDAPTSYFHPYRVVAHAEIMRMEEPAPDDMRPAIDDVERFLLTVFLRRYVTWCARAGREIQATWATDLWRQVRIVATSNDGVTR